MHSSDTSAQKVRILQFAMLLGALVFAAVVLVFTRNGEMPPQDVGPVLPWLGAGLAVAATIAAVTVRATFRKQLQQQPHVSPGDRAARLGILPAAILESAILFNLVTWMVTGSQWPNAVAATLPFAVALAFAIKGPPAD
jgi:hypothetical protein